MLALSIRTGPGYILRCIPIVATSIIAEVRNMLGVSLHIKVSKGKKYLSSVAEDNMEDTMFWI